MFKSGVDSIKALISLPTLKTIKEIKSLSFSMSAKANESVSPTRCGPSPWPPWPGDLRNPSVCSTGAFGRIKQKQSAVNVSHLVHFFPILWRYRRYRRYRRLALSLVTIVGRFVWNRKKKKEKKIEKKFLNVGMSRSLSANTWRVTRDQPTFSLFKSKDEINPLKSSLFHWFNHLWIKFINKCTLF